MKTDEILEVGGILASVINNLNLAGHALLRLSQNVGELRELVERQVIGEESVGATVIDFKKGK
jgi:hypothetical protein